MKILLLGPHGQVGWELQRSLAPLGEVVLAERRQADLANPESLRACVQSVRPTVIVNAAAHTAVDKAESEPDLAQAINATAPRVLADEARRLGTLLVHYSTDYVFDGSGDQARDESAATGPLSVYGHSKLAGEQAIVASGCQHLIFRTSWVYAARGGNFAKTMLRLAAERDSLNVIEVQIGAPTGADLIADVSAHAIRATLADPSRSGLYHLVAAGQTSWFGYARHVIERARAMGRPIQVASGRIQPIPTSAYPTPAQRPLNSRLSTQRLQSRFDLHLPHWQVGVNRMLDEILAA